jgi:hypothetical protein
MGTLEWMGETHSLAVGDLLRVRGERERSVGEEQRGKRGEGEEW